MLPYRRRRFREEEEEDDVGWLIAAAVAHVAPPARAAEAASGSSSPRSADEPTPSPSPSPHPAPLRIDEAEATDSIIQLGDPTQADDAAEAAPDLTTPTPHESASSAVAHSDSSQADASPEQSSPAPSRSSRSSGGVTRAGRSRHSLEGSGRKARVDVFVQRWDARRVSEAYEQLLVVLYPSYEPSQAGVESIDSSLAALLDEWTEEVNRATRSVLLDNVRAGGPAAGDHGANGGIGGAHSSGGKYQMHSAIDRWSDSRQRPLVIGSADLRELMAQPFDEVPPMSFASDPAAGALGLEGEDDEDGEDGAAAGGVQPSRVRIQLQAAVRPFLEQVLSLHQVTLPNTPLRDRLRETLSALAGACYGYEMQLFACALESFKSLPSSTLSAGTLQRLLAHVIHFAFEFHSQMEDASRDALASFLLHLLRGHMGSLTPSLHLSMLEAARLNELGAATSEMASNLILPFVVKHMPAQLLGWCACGRAGPDSVTPPPPVRNGAGAISPLSSSGRAQAASANSGEVAVAACVLCQRETAELLATTPQSIASLCVARMVDSVTSAKSIQGDMGRFMRAKCGATLGPSVLALTAAICAPSTPSPASPTAGTAPTTTFSSLRKLGRATAAQHMLCNLLLLACKWIQLDVQSPHETVAQAILRREHGLHLALQVLQWSGGFFLSCPQRLLLLRGVLAPSLLACCLGSFRARSSSHFALVLRLLTQVWEHDVAFLPAELCLLLQHALLPMLEAGFATLRQKEQIISTLHTSLLATPRHLMLVFVNCDFNHAAHDWKLLDTLFATLVRVLENDVDAFVHPPPSSSAQQGGEHGGDGGDHGGDGGGGGDHDDDDSSDSEDEEEEVSQASLTHSALKLLVHLVFMQAQWLGVPGLKRTGSVPPALQNQESNKEVWHAVLQQHRREQQIDDQVLQLARSGKLKAALRYQSQVKACTASVDEMARYLMETESLNKADVGDFLANLDDDFLDKKQYDELRRAYVRRLDFTGLSFDEALRLFLCDSGFRLPGEAQKIDRMLDAFCQQFVADNPGMFRNASSAFIVCFALVMLNTDLHDPRLKTGKSSRKPMSIEQFISNLRGVDDGASFPPSFLRRMFVRIKERAIEWKEDYEQQNDKGATKVQTVTQQAQAQLSGAVRASAQLRRLVEKKMQRSLLSHHSWSSPSSAWLVAPLYDLSWFRALGTFSLLREHDAMLNLCLDGLAYGTTIALALGARTPTNAFLNVLAKLTYVETARSEYRQQLLMEDISRRQRAPTLSPLPSSPPPPPPVALPPALSRADAETHFRATMERNITKRAHHKQAWFVALSADLDDVQGVSKGVFHICSVTKKQLNQERRFVRVQQLQDIFGDAVSLYCPGREVLREGLLWKFKASSSSSSSAAGSLDANDPLASNGGGSRRAAMVHAATAAHQPFYFFLLTDLLIFASDGGDSSSTPYKWKHAFHLSMLHCEELPQDEEGEEGEEEDGRRNAPSIFPFTLTTPQSSSPLHLAAADASTRAKWIGAIQAQRDMLAKRADSCAALRPLHPAKRLSCFVGAPLSVSMDAELVVVDPAHHCRLCLRALHPIFRRAAHCTWCGGPVCSKCCQKRIRLPPHLLAQCSVQREREPHAAAATATPTTMADSVSPLPPSSGTPPSPPVPSVPHSLSAEPTHSSAASLSPSPPEPSSAPVASHSSFVGLSGSLGAFGSASLSSFSSSSSAFFSKLNSAAQASVSSMHSKLRKTMWRLNDKEGVAVCDACVAPIGELMLHPAPPLPPISATTTNGGRARGSSTSIDAAPTTPTGEDMIDLR